jgi:hypothetical protein
MRRGHRAGAQAVCAHVRLGLCARGVQAAHTGVRAAPQAAATDAHLFIWRVAVAAAGHAPPEAMAVAGMPHTAGLVARRRRSSAERGAAAVGALRKADAVVLCVTNVSELCMWMETY